MKRKFISIGSILILGLAANVFLYWSAHTTNVKNHFKRNFLSDSIALRYIINLGDTHLYFAGWIDSTCYVGKSNDPFHLVALQKERIQSISIAHPDNTSCRFSRISIDSLYFQFADLETNSIYRGNVRDWTIKDTVHLRGVFSEEIPISKTSSVLRDLNSSKTEFIVSKETYWPSPVVIHSDQLIEKQMDGLFSTDGMLRYDRTTHQLIYTYFYRNQFFVTDTSLHLLNRGRTIDTISTAKIKVTRIPSAKVTTLSSPPAIVNRYSYANDGKLYVASTLIADNEAPSSFNTSDVIDVYRIPKGDYLASFYLPRTNGKKLLHFAVHDHALFVIRDVTLSVYHLPSFL